MLDETKEISVKLNAYELLHELFNAFSNDDIADYLQSVPRGWHNLLGECSELTLAEELVRRLGLRDAVQTLQYANEQILKNKTKQS